MVSLPGDVIPAHAGIRSIQNLNMRYAKNSSRFTDSSSVYGYWLSPV